MDNGNKHAIFWLSLAGFVFVLGISLYILVSETPTSKFHVGDKVKFKLDGRIGIVSDEVEHENGIRVRINRPKIHFWNDSAPYEELPVKPGELERVDE